jgi:hypothetical protein
MVCSALQAAALVDVNEKPEEDTPVEQPPDIHWSEFWRCVAGSLGSNKLNEEVKTKIRLWVPKAFLDYPA